MLAPSRRDEPHGLQVGQPRTLMHLLAGGVTSHHAKNGHRFLYAPVPHVKCENTRRLTVEATIQL